MDQQAFSIPEFCAAHRLSRAFLYQLMKDGRAPAFMKIGRRRLITVEAAAAWRQRMTRESTIASKGSK